MLWLNRLVAHLRGVQLPDLSSELSFRAVRGSGPGGQHVNKTSTKVELRWRPADTQGFTASDKSRLAAKLAPRLTGDGELLLTDHSTRSQSRNREIVTERFYGLLRDGLRREKRRRKTKPTLGSKKRRLAGKKHRGEVKRGRGRVGLD